MNFANNWSQPITLDAGVTVLGGVTGLPDGNYLLTLTDSVTTPSRWEIVAADLVTGNAVLERGQEGTTDQAWPSGSIIYCSITAGQVSSLFEAIADQLVMIEELQERVTALEPPPIVSVFSGIDVSMNTGVFESSSINQIVLYYEYSAVKTLGESDLVASYGVSSVGFSAAALINGETIARFMIAEGVELPQHDSIHLNYYGLPDAVISLVNQLGDTFYAQQTGARENSGFTFTFS